MKSKSLQHFFLLLVSWCTNKVLISSVVSEILTAFCLLFVDKGNALGGRLLGPACLRWAVFPGLFNLGTTITPCRCVVIQKTQPFLSPGHTCLTWPLTVAPDVRVLDEKSGVKKYMVYYTTVLKVTWDETPIFWSPDVKNWLIGKDPDAGKAWGQEEKGTTEDESWWWTGRPRVLQPMGSDGHYWATELNWNDKWKKHGNFCKKDFF